MTPHRYATTRSINCVGVFTRLVCSEGLACQRWPRDMACGSCGARCRHARRTDNWNAISACEYRPDPSSRFAATFSPGNSADLIPKDRSRLTPRVASPECLVSRTRTNGPCAHRCVRATCLPSNGGKRTATLSNCVDAVSRRKKNGRQIGCQETWKPPSTARS